MTRTLLTILYVLLAGHMVVQAAASDTRRDEDVTFRNGSISIAGTLSLPQGPGPFPAVVLLSGSGPQDRDSELGGFRPFKLMADAFVDRGIAVLRCDDRGVGGSTGNLADSTSEDLADDALAAIAMLHARTDIGRIGILGHSEGAVVASIAASKSRDVAFIVWMAGNAVSGREILQMQAGAMAHAAGATDEAVDDILRQHAAFMTAILDDAPIERVTSTGRALMTTQLSVLPPAQRAAAGDPEVILDRLVTQNMAMLRSPWMRFFARFDPATALRHVTCPLFAVFGGLDLQVPAGANRARLEASLGDPAHRDLTVRVYPSANHLFMPAVTGQLAEYGTLPKMFVPSLLDDIGAWMAGAATR
jgi:fermentation-respiration switch protein FrsA (DUF1100 family)